MSFIGTQDYDLEVARGNVSDVKQFSKLGYNLDLDTADGFQVVWNANVAWTPITAAETLDIVSDDANDAAAGTGAQEVTITGLDASGDEQVVVIATNGLTTVTTAETWLAVNEVQVTDAGSSTWNEGNITVDGNTSGNTQGFITLETSVSHQLFFTVPTGKSAYVEKIFMRVAKTSGGSAPKVELKMFKSVGNVIVEIQPAIIDADFDAQLNEILINPVRIAAGERWWIEAETDTNNTFIRGSIEQKIADD